MPAVVVCNEVDCLVHVSTARLVGRAKRLPGDARTVIRLKVVRYFNSVFVLDRVSWRAHLRVVKVSLEKLHVGINPFVHDEGREYHKNQQHGCSRTGSGHGRGKGDDSRSDGEIAYKQEVIIKLSRNEENKLKNGQAD